jgi:hypothetical protein
MSKESKMFAYIQRKTDIKDDQMDIKDIAISWLSIE